MKCRRDSGVCVTVGEDPATPSGQCYPAVTRGDVYTREGRGSGKLL